MNRAVAVCCAATGGFEEKRVVKAICNNAMLLLNFVPNHPLIFSKPYCLQLLRCPDIVKVSYCIQILARSWLWLLSWTFCYGGFVQGQPMIRQCYNLTSFVLLQAQDWVCNLSKPVSSGSKPFSGSFLIFHPSRGLGWGITSNGQHSGSSIQAPAFCLNDIALVYRHSFSGWLSLLTSNLLFLAACRAENLTFAAWSAAGARMWGEFRGLALYAALCIELCVGWYTALHATFCIQLCVGWHTALHAAFCIELCVGWHTALHATFCIQLCVGFSTQHCMQLYAFSFV